MVPLKYLSNSWKTLEMPLINWEINLILILMVPLKFLINFWITLQMPLINCEINFILTRSAHSLQ